MKGYIMNYKNRYQKACYALEWLRANHKTHREAAERFDIRNKNLIANVASLKKVRPDLYELVKEGNLAYNNAYARYRREVK
jgi:hypothetical protein